MLCGSASRNGHPFDAVKLTMYGVAEFQDIVTHVSRLPHILEAEHLTIHPALAVKLYDKIKDSFAAIL